MNYFLGDCLGDGRGDSAMEWFQLNPFTETVLHNQ